MNGRPSDSKQYVRDRSRRRRADINNNPTKRAEHLKKLRDAASKFTAQRKIRVLEAYGGRCRRCGETDYDVLTIDHLGGTGPTHKESLRQSGIKRPGTPYVYRDIEKRGYPKGEFRVLCFNCNIKVYVLAKRKKSRESIGLHH